ncbi:hypothetical protein [Nitrospirillum sp. BR 11163]|uniref:hypothetical protein n=1 Tax=Nitrospirillum sp. BR 11163 TaxID=3104323 RepID=UPI002AFEB4FC|nr:hypothetical protein [Nitrospirillum sp. BR 11163]MEA1676281.1 hypothetical protein [Nitrospirillum sp. BR 11163]
MSDENIQVLQLTFDAQQMGAPLQHEIKVDGVSSLQTAGRFAGSYILFYGQEMQIKVTAYCDAEVSIQLMDLALISTPVNVASMKPLYDLSPYDTNSAGYIIRDWKPSEGPSPGNFRRHLDSLPSSDPQVKYFEAAHRPLITVPNGLWQVSGYLSVKVSGLPDTDPYCRVYTFDPSVVVGGGGNPR